MKLVLLLVLSCMVVLTTSWFIPAPRIRIPRIRFPRIRIPKIPLPRIRIPRIRLRRLFGKRDVLPADDIDLDEQFENADLSFDEVARLVRELPEYDETVRSLDDVSMIDHDPQEHE